MAPTPTASELRRAFDAAGPLTIGLEEELMLLDPGTLDLSPRARDVLARTEGDARFKPEMPAAQLEIITAPHTTVPDAITELAASRRDLAEAAHGIGRLATAGVHPFTKPLGALNQSQRYAATEREYGTVARAQLVCGLQVHVAVGGADRSLAVYNALRSHLPEIAALAANAPFIDGLDSGLASVRPKICDLLPRQGVPPALESWNAFAAALRWGATAGGVPEPRRWWWELRPHPAFGTLELRVPDAQARIDDAAAVAAVVHALTAHLAARHDAGDLPPPVATWRIEENRWWACRDGVEGELADLETGERRPARERLHALLDDLEPEAERLGCARPLRQARDLVDTNGAMRQRSAAGRPADTRAVVGWLVDAYAGRE